MKKDQYPSRIDFDSWQESFIKRMWLSAGYYKYGLVKYGLELTLEGDKLSCTSGFGISPAGNPLSFTKKEASFTVGDGNYFIYLTRDYILKDDISLKDINDKEIFNDYKRVVKAVYPDVLKVNDIPENPYTHKIFDNTKSLAKAEENDYLVIGCIKNGKVYALNREYQENNLAQGATGLYYNIFYEDFIPYITLRGCVVDDELLGRFIKFSTDFGKSGGDSNPYLKASAIPSLGDITGVTDMNTNSYEHEYEIYSYINDDVWANYGDRWWSRVDITENRDTGDEGRHSHDVKKGNFVNNSQLRLNIEPRHITLLPVKRVA